MARTWPSVPGVSRATGRTARGFRLGDPPSTRQADPGKGPGPGWVAQGQAGSSGDGGGASGSAQQLMTGAGCRATQQDLGVPSCTAQVLMVGVQASCSNAMSSSRKALELVNLAVGMGSVYSVRTTGGP